jgi:5-methylcytosine-specific restriction endonuclease McrA
MREAVRALYGQGLTQREIAARLDVTKSTVAFHVRRLDHPPDQRFARRYNWTEIRKAYEGGLSYRQCKARFGFTAKSWYDAVARGDILPRPVAIPIEELLVAGRRRSRSHLKGRLLAAGIKENRCEECGITEWRDKPLNMALHHVNGDGTDNRIENIVFLCPNCHAQTPNYGGRNGHRRIRAEAGGEAA